MRSGFDFHLYCCYLWRAYTDVEILAGWLSFLKGGWLPPCKVYDIKTKARRLKFNSYIAQHSAMDEKASTLGITRWRESEAIANMACDKVRTTA